MDIHTLPASLPHVVIVDADQRQSSVDLAKKMIGAGLGFTYIAPEPELLPDNVRKHWRETAFDLDKNIGIIVDMTWSVPLTDDTILILNDVDLDAPPLILTTNANETTGSASELLPEFDFIGFNGLPGFFPLGTSVEVAPPRGAHPEALAMAKRFFRTLGFEVELIEDRPGYVLPRIISMIINEAAFCVMEGVAEPEAIDTAMKLGTNYPRGPLAWADEIGIDVVTTILIMLESEYRQERYRPCQLLLQMTHNSELGVVSGSGFYEHPGAVGEL